MKKIALAGLAGMLLVSASVNAMSIRVMLPTY